MNLWVLLGAQYHIASIFSWITIMYRQPNSMPLAHHVFLVMALLPVPVGWYLSLRYGQGGSRLKNRPAATLGLSRLEAAPNQDPPVGDRTPDNCWKLGQIYFNPEDPALWIEKRAGFGYTLNFGRIESWLLLIVILAAPPVLVWPIPRLLP